MTSEIVEAGPACFAATCAGEHEHARPDGGAEADGRQRNGPERPAQATFTAHGAWLTVCTPKNCRRKLMYGARPR